MIIKYIVQSCYFAFPFIAMQRSQKEIDEISRKIIGAAIAVHTSLGSGFQEFVYQKALAIEMNWLGLSHAWEKEMPIFYRGQQIATRRVDFFVDGCMVLELKVVPEITEAHKSQAIHYLETFNKADGLIINFGEPTLKFKRVFNKRMVDPRDFVKPGEET